MGGDGVGGLGGFLWPGFAGWRPGDNFKSEGGVFIEVFGEEGFERVGGIRVPAFNVGSVVVEVMPEGGRMQVDGYDGCVGEFFLQGGFKIA